MQNYQLLIMRYLYTLKSNRAIQITEFRQDAIAFDRGFTVVTNNVKHFEKIESLKLETLKRSRFVSIALTIKQ